MNCNSVKHFNRVADALPMRTWFWQTFVHSFTEQILYTSYTPSAVLVAGRNNPIMLTPLESTLHLCPSYYNLGSEDHSRAKVFLLQGNLSAHVFRNLVVLPHLHEVICGIIQF